MYNSQNRSNGGNDPPRERLPPFLLSSSGASPAPSGRLSGTLTPRFQRDGPPRPASFNYRSQSALTTSDLGVGANWSRRFGAISGTNATGNSTTPIAFNDRLRTDRSSIQFETNTDSQSTDVNVPSKGVVAPRTPVRMPPNKSLLDTGPPSVVNLRGSGNTPTGGMSTTPTNMVNNYMPMSTTPTVTPTSMKFNSANRGGTEGCECWVTVFGFAPTMESQVMRELRRDGEIVRSIPGRGNWIHILFRTPLQANVALNRPWRMLAGTDVMIGTVPCTEPSVAIQAEDDVNRGVLMASPGAKDVVMGLSPAEMSAAKSLRKSNLSGSTPRNLVNSSPAFTNHQGLRTPASILRRDQGVAIGPNSIVKTPQRQSGILDYLSSFL